VALNEKVNDLSTTLHRDGRKTRFKQIEEEKEPHIVRSQRGTLDRITA